MARVSSGFAPLPFNKNGSVDAIVLRDDFITLVDVADLVDGNGAMVQSELHWLGSEIAGGAVSNVTGIAGVADHPGIARLAVGATSPADGDAAALQLGGQVDDDQDVFILDGNGVYLATIVRIADVDAAIMEFGLIGQAPAVPNSSAADVVSIVFDPEDAANVGDKWFFGQVNAATVDTEVVLDGVNYVEGDWVLLEIEANDTSATFRVTTEDGSDTATIQTTMPTVGLRPAYGIENVGAAEEVLDIDSFVLRYWRRVPLGSSGYLGA